MKWQLGSAFAVVVLMTSCAGSTSLVADQEAIGACRYGPAELDVIRTAGSGIGTDMGYQVVAELAATSHAISKPLQSQIGGAQSDVNRTTALASLHEWCKKYDVTWGDPPSAASSSTTRDTAFLNQVRMLPALRSDDDATLLKWGKAICDTLKSTDAGTTARAASGLWDIETGSAVWLVTASQIALCPTKTTATT